MLAPSAFLASAAGTTELQARILPPAISIVPDDSVISALRSWSARSQSSPPTGTDAYSQGNWDLACIQKVKEQLLDGACDPRDHA